MLSVDLKGCLSSLIPLLTSHPSLSPPLRKAESKAPSTGSAELPPEYLTSPLSQQSQVIWWSFCACADSKCKQLNVLDAGPASCILICPILPADASQEGRGGAAGGGGAAAGHCSFPKWGWGEGAHGEWHSGNVPSHFWIYYLLIEIHFNDFIVTGMCIQTGSELKQYIILFYFLFRIFSVLLKF